MAKSEENDLLVLKAIDS